MIRITLRLIEPLHLAASHTVAPIASTLNFIPGTALRGALAQKYLEHKGHQPEDDNFQKWFLADSVRFGPLTPLGNRFDNQTVSNPLPLTAFTCKLYPGFCSNKSINHGVRDMLFEFIKGDDHLPDDRCDKQSCESYLIPFNGFYSEGKSSELIMIRKRLETRTAINSISETAAQKQLFSLEVIEEDQMFGGVIELETTQQEEDFKEMLIKDGSEIRLGAARTRGLGLTQIFESTIPNTPRLTLAALANQINTFSNYALCEQKIACKESLCFSLTLLSDCIIRDEYLRFQGNISQQSLSTYVHPAFKNANPLGSFCRTRLVDGWNAAQKNPRPTEVAICAGSVFVYGINASPEELAGYLVHLDRDGIGERTLEGYGKVAICHEFHMQEEQR